MSINLKPVKYIAATFALLLTSTNLWATDCYVLSPGLESLGDDYYNIEQQPAASRSEQQQMNRFFNDLKGDWQGKSTQIDCRGPDSKPRKVVKSFEVKAEFTQPSHGLNVKLQRRDAEQKVTKHDHFPLYIAADLYTIEFEDDRPVVISHKARRAIQVQKTTRLKNSYKEYQKIKQQIARIKQQINQIIDAIKELRKELVTLDSDSEEYQKVQQRITQNELEVNRLEQEIERLKLALENFDSGSDNANIKQYSRLVEKTVELSINNNQLTLTFLHFNNGIFVAEETIELYR
ncbi:hypothetical protein A9Q78_05340 [Methylophaga sp. 41_12_T18]|nr:hypothetical protein A9Q78_05340 [Methylophaga sp. 41_12_T18]